MMSRSKVTLAQRATRPGAVLPPTPEAQEAEAQQTALRLLPKTGEAARALPSLVTASDVREAVRYLKKKPAGVSPAEAMGDAGRRTFEPRKVEAYEILGVVERVRGRLSLSPVGREFARSLEPVAEAHRALLARTEAYHAALEWIHLQGRELVTHDEVAALWLELYGDSLGLGGKDDEGYAVCFFHMCQAAGLGTMTIGKRGQPARLRVERGELARYVGGTRPRAESGASEGGTDAARAGTGMSGSRDDEGRAKESATETLRIFMSVAGDAPYAEQVRTILSVGDNECHVSARREQGSLLVPEERARTMRGCDAALFVVTAGDVRGGAELGLDLMIEICAAEILYEGRVALVCDEGLSLPPALDGLPRFLIGGDGLTLEVGIGLLKVFKEFQRRARHAA